MDQVLKDLMIAVAEEDQQNAVEGMQGDEGEDEINEIMSKVYKIRSWEEMPATCATQIRLVTRFPHYWCWMLIAFLDTDSLVTVKGLVIRATPIIPDMKTAFFRCLNCSHTVQVEIDRGRIEEPAR